MPRCWVTAFILILVFTITACTDQKDTVSSASNKNKSHITITIPESTAHSQVLGELPGLKNFVVRYDDLLYRGGKPTHKNAIKSLKKLGVKTIVSITPDDSERIWARQGGFELLEIPFDSKNPISPVHVEQFRNLLNADHGVLYIHCQGGTQRAALLGILYRIYAQGWPAETAIQEYYHLGGSSDSNWVKMIADFI